MLAVALTLPLTRAGAARADDAKERLELRGGDRVEGRVLCVGAKWVIVDAPGGQRFVDRGSIAAAKAADGSPIDLAARETSETRDVVGLFVDIFNEKVRVNRGDTWFEPTALSTEKGITSSLLRTGDELRTGPWGRIKALLPRGAVLTAGRDAVIQFASSGPVLVRGSARFKDGDVSVTIPEGRASGEGVDVALDHTRGRTEITCYKGNCEVQGDGWTLELFKNHTVDVSNGAGEQAPYIAANAANSFPVELRVGPKRIQIQPSQTVCLVIIHSEREGAASDPQASRPREPSPPPEEPERHQVRPAPFDEPAPRVTPSPADPAVVRDPPGQGAVQAVAGRVTEASDSFWHTRSGAQPAQVPPERASNLVLHAGDEVSTDEARLTLELERPRATVKLNYNTAVVLPPGDDAKGAAPIPLKRGQVSARTAGGAIVLSAPAGEVTVEEGEAIVTATATATQVRAREGRSVLRVGRDATAEVLPGIDVSGSVATANTTPGSPPGADRGATKLEATGKGASSVRVARVLSLQLPAGKAMECGRTEEGAIWATLWNNARLELDPSIEVTVDEVDGALYATTRSGAHRLLAPGAVVRLGAADVAPPQPQPEKPLVEAPPRAPDPSPFVQEPPAPRPETPRVERAAAGRETRTLSNGAVLTLVNWGSLVEKRSQGGLVEIEGPGGSPLLLAAGTRLTLRRARSGDVIVSTDDHRTITWAQSNQTASFALKLEQDGKLSIDLSDDRALAVEKGASFELELRADGLVHAELVQQTVFIDKGSHLVVDRSGYRATAPDMAKAAGSR